MVDVVEHSDPLEAFHSLEPADKDFDVTWVSTKVMSTLVLRTLSLSLSFFGVRHWVGDIDDWISFVK